MPRPSLLLALTLIATPAAALESPPVQSPRMTATLISDTDAVQAGAPLHLALRLRMAPGWHTYWQNPGDAGAPPDLKLTLSDGAVASGIAWPTPARLPEGPVMTYSYVDEVVLPVTVTPGSAGLEVTATATWLVCERLCVPEEGTFQLSLPAGIPAPSPETPLFAASIARQPRPSPFAAQIAPDGTLSLQGDGLSAAAVADAWFLPAAWGAIEQAAPQPVQVGPGRVTIQLQPGSAFTPGGLDGTVVLRDARGQESYLQVSATPGAAPIAMPGSMPVGQMLGFALLGGLILNLMPCVFPILAMKGVALARLSGQGRRVVRAHALTYTAGVLTAFAALGGLMLGMRAAGVGAGWGFQFQSPGFVAGMAWLLFAIGLNLSGVFRIGSRLAGAGQDLVTRGGHAGSFFTGLLAVVVATPCTAPFMGVTIAAALAAPAGVAMPVFLAMGLGLAAPFAALACFPPFARVLPRPGAWMDVLRGALAFPMYAASAWLVWVISVQAGPSGVLGAASGLVLTGFAAWCCRLAQATGRRRGYGAAAIALALALATLPRIGGNASAAVVTDGAEPFTPARLAELRDQGRPVFVNMTAAWCVTCLVNERLALSPGAVRQAFAERGVTYLKGDWTRGDPAITNFLRDHARDGVPLYVMYPRGKAAPNILPQILTESEMLSQLSRVGG